MKTGAKTPRPARSSIDNRGGRMRPSPGTAPLADSQTEARGKQQQLAQLLDIVLEQRWEVREISELCLKTSSLCRSKFNRTRKKSAALESFPTRTTAPVQRRPRSGRGPNAQSATHARIPGGCRNLGTGRTNRYGAPRVRNSQLRPMPVPRQGFASCDGLPEVPRLNRSLGNRRLGNRSLGKLRLVLRRNLRRRGSRWNRRRPRQRLTVASWRRGMPVAD